VRGVVGVRVVFSFVFLSGWWVFGIFAGEYHAEEGSVCESYDDAVYILDHYVMPLLYVGCMFL
jgi:hypothetical protein